MTLNIDVQKALLAHVNLGNEGKGDGMISRLDLKFTFNATSDFLSSVLNLGDDHKSMYWRDGILIEGMGEQVITTEWNHNDLTFGVLDSMFDEDKAMRVVASNCAVKNMKLTPMDNHLLDVSLTCQVRDPDEHQMYQISAFQKKEGGLHIEFDDSIVDDDGQEDGQQEL